MYGICINENAAVRLPKVGEECSAARLLEICRAFGMQEQERIIRDDPPPRPFVFDGCSGPAPERTPGGADLHLPCLLHDIEYWCDYADAERARERRAAADYRLALRMLDAGASAGIAALYLSGVRIAGRWWPGASWGYGRR